MEYKYERKGGDAQIEIQDKDKVLLFRLSSTPSNPAMLGDEVTSEMIEAENKRALLHSVLLEKFENEMELQKFCEFLIQDPNSGYSSYLESIKINEILNQIK